MIDTNVLIDYLSVREPFFNDAQKIISLCSNNKISGYMAANSILDIFYILRKNLSEKNRRARLLDLSNILTIINIDDDVICSALSNSKFSDLEDCVQSLCAKKENIEYIITRNTKDFKRSNIPAITPKEFLDII